MPAAETARLLASLELQDKFSKTADAALRKTGQLEGGFARLGGHASRGLATAGRNLSIAAAGLTVGLAAAVRSGLDSLATLESAVTSVDGAIAQVGLTGQVTGKQVADWANQIEADVGAAFDDKDITAAAATLLRFGKVTATNLKPALVVMTDLAAKTGSVDSAAELLAKALADPEKAAGKLARTGIVLTKQQQAQIKALVAAGKTTEAQALLLEELEKATKGAAAASQGPYQRAISTLSDVSEDARRALAEGFLPLIQKVADMLRTRLADPKVLGDIRNFGQGLAGAFERALDFAQKIPWDTIGSGVKTAAEFSGKLFDAFRNLPPEVQGTLVALAGLNKLTGGAPLKIAVDFAQGAFGAFLGRGASPAVPMWVQQVGGAAAVAGGAGGSKLVGVGAGLLGGAGLAGVASEIEDDVQGFAVELHKALDLPDIKFDQLDWPWGPKNTPKLDIGPLKSILGGSEGEEINLPNTVNMGTFAKIGEFIKPGRISDEVTGALGGKLGSIDDSASDLVQRAGIAASLQRDENRILGAVLARPTPAPIVNNNISVNISSRDTTSVQVTERIASTGMNTEVM